MASPPQTLPADFFSKKLGMASPSASPPATLPADFFSKKTTDGNPQLEGLKSEGFLESAWNAIKSPIGAAKEMLTPRSRAEKEAQVQKALNWADRFVAAHQNGTDAEKKAVNDEALVSLPFGSTVYKAKEGNYAGAAGDVAGLAALGGVAKAAGNPVVQGAVKGAAKSAVEIQPMTLRGVTVPVPTVGASAAGGGAVTSMMGLGHAPGVVIGAAVPIIRGAMRGGKAALAERALAADAAKIPPDVMEQLTRESSLPEATVPQAAPEEAATPQGQPISTPAPRWEDAAALDRLQAAQASAKPAAPVPAEAAVTPAPTPPQEAAPGAAQPPIPANESPAPSSRVVQTTTADGVGQSKLMSEEGMLSYAKEHGFTEAEARTRLEQSGHSILTRGRINRALHGMASELGIDHAGLSDIAGMEHGVKSLTQLSQDDLLGMYENLQNKRSISEPLVPKSLQGLTKPELAATVSKMTKPGLAELAEQAGLPVDSTPQQIMEAMVKEMAKNAAAGKGNQ